MFRRIDCVIFCGVLVPSNYVLRSVACTNMTNNSICGVFGCGIVAVALFGSGPVYLALCSTWNTLVVFLVLLAYV